MIIPDERILDGSGSQDCGNQGTAFSLIDEISATVFSF
jgi:hypothetical protein